MKLKQRLINVYYNYPYSRSPYKLGFPHIMRSRSKKEAKYLNKPTAFCLRFRVTMKPC